MTNGYYSEAADLFDSIASSALSSPALQADASDAGVLLAIVQQMNTDTAASSLPDSASVDQLQQLATGKGLTAVYARNILLHAGESQYIEPVGVDNQLKSAKTIYQRRSVPATCTELLTAYPNPARHYLVAEVHTASGNSLLRLTDNSGALMGEYPVNRSNDQMIISTGHLAPGIYYLCLWEEGRLTSTFKVNIQ